MATKIQIRRDTAANWASGNPILLKGEPGFVTDGDFFIMGDGVSDAVALMAATKNRYLSHSEILKLIPAPTPASPNYIWMRFENRYVNLSDNIDYHFGIQSFETPFTTFSKRSIKTAESITVRAAAFSSWNSNPGSVSAEETELVLDVEDGESEQELFSGVEFSSGGSSEVFLSANGFDFTIAKDKRIAARLNGISYDTNPVSLRLTLDVLAEINLE